VDPDELAIQAARANAARHGLSARATFLHAPDTTQLPFEAASFDLVSCISVLEYVDPGSIHAIQREIDRVLRPGGHFVLYATGNRLWPLETHHRRWLVNYLPPEVDRVLFGRPVRRGVWPWEVRRGLPDYLDRSGEDGGRRLVEVKARQGLPTSRLLALRAVNRVLGPLGLHHGYVTPNLAMVLQKPIPA
jgi:SAM-dependent methyltransferase